ncbi:hypothetical protein O0I10_011035 [Lichtheimia ornata]|uniref:F-box domain-containing protein n=1 Tax=Lichtheimia ornata TaxID=688661 RepID=A0AAD7XUG7_9FUNG|nr:uncharacterized protein O0I10_011035 [Lichtheimia ornata]KAJ8653286.1 hypothetical protein O0I10_011035 [Lichtheimia ornata]
MLERLPTEILCEIVHDFSRRDFIECVQVNRYWRQRLPPYSSHLWKHVDIKTHDHLIFLAQTSCFGQYIDSCKITMLSKDALLYHALEQLQGYHLQSLVLDYFRIEDNERLIDLLKNVRCESLKFTGVTGACLDFVGIITASSGGVGGDGHMRHFACHYDLMYPMLMFDDDDDDMCLYPPPAPPLPNTNGLGLVSLALTTQNLQVDWMGLLQRCSTTLQHLHIDVTDPIICRDIMNACPQLQSMFIGEFAVPEIVTWPPPPPSSSDKPGLRHLGYYGQCHDIDIMEFVLEHQHTLETLYFDTCIPIQIPPWSDINAFQSTSLKTLVSSHTHETLPDTLVHLIRQSSNLETVVLHQVNSASDKIWDTLMNLDTLQNLSLHVHIWEYDPNRAWEWHTLIHRLGTMTTLRQLELVALDGAKSIECAQLFRMLDGIQLVKLRLLSIHVLSDRTLEALLPHAPLMEQVDIVDCPIVTTCGIKALIDGLPKVRNVTFLLSKEQRIPDDVDELTSYAKGKGVKLVVDSLD